MNFIKRLFGWRKCGLCKENFKSKKTDQIYIKDPNMGDYNKIDICVHCASILEATKMKEEDVPYSISNSS